MLASATDAKSLSDSGIMQVASFLYGAPDWEGLLVQDIRVALHKLPALVRGPIETALELVHVNLNGCGWEWLLRSCSKHEIDDKGLKRYYADITKLMPGGYTIHTNANHQIASYALMMSLIDAVEIERHHQSQRS